MGSRPLVSAVVVSYGTRELTLAAVGSLSEFLPDSSEIWVVDNASDDGSAEAVRELFPDVNLVRLTQNVGFGRANNLAMGRAAGDFFLLLNSDARLTDVMTVPEMLKQMEDQPRLGLVGPRLESEDGQLEFSARSFPTLPKELVRRLGLYRLLPGDRVGRWLLGDFWAPSDAVWVDWLTGACILARREAYEAVGGFDPRIFMYGEEQEWARRIKRAGWDVLYEPRVSVVHRRAASGPQGTWRVRAALEADVRIFRWTHGRVPTLVLNLVRLTGFLLEAATLRAMEMARPSAYKRQRRRGAWRAFRQQVRVTARRPFG